MVASLALGTRAAADGERGIGRNSDIYTHRYACSYAFVCVDIVYQATLEGPINLAKRI